jgi:tight adherence protein C
MTLALVLAISGALALAMALAVLVYAVGSAPKPPPSRLGLRGYKRVRSLAENQAFASVEPTMRFISQRIYSLLSPNLRASFDREISMAGNVAGLQPEDLAALSLMSCLCGTCLGIAYGYAQGRGNVVLFGVLLAAAGLALPYLSLASRASERQKRISVSMPQIIDLLALGLGAGLDFPSAIRQVIDRTAHPDSPLFEELRLLLQDLSLGRTRRFALEQMAVRAPCEPVRDLVGAVVQSEEQGTPLADVLRVQAASSRVQRSAGAEEAAAKAASKLMFPLVLLFICVLTLIVGPVALSFMDTFSAS